MLAIPSALQSKFDEQLQIRAIPNALHGPYQKWLRYYLDFCQKYQFPPRQEKSLPHSSGNCRISSNPKRSRSRPQRRSQSITIF